MMSHPSRGFDIQLKVLACFLLICYVDGLAIKPEDCDSEKFYLCQEGNTCISKQKVCDRHVDCPSGDDEKDCDLENCTQNSFWCRDNRSCIDSKLTCDGFANCRDGSDEHDSLCPGMTSRKPCDPQKEFECEANICIPKSLMCNGIIDCFNRRDEEPLMCSTRNVTCPGFQCENKQCLIDEDWVCDEEEDCSDGSDEKHCDADCKITDGKFLCQGHHCIKLSMVCDGKKDCVDGSDEGGACSRSDTCLTKNCEGSCMVLPFGAICLCRSGMTYNTATKKCEESNKCNTYGICSQGCVNTNDSHICTCSDGFQLAEDKKTCMASDNHTVLVYSTTNGVNAIYLKASQNQTRSENIVRTKGTVGVTYDGSNFYWSDVSTGRESIVKYSLALKKKENLLIAGLHTPEDLAVDWLTENIYITDSELKRIGVCDKTGAYCLALISYKILDKPRSIALHPSESLMFWTDWGKSPHIGVAFMDGSHSEILIDDVEWPNGLALDVPNGRIYWVDAKKKTIESSTISGKDRRIILSDIVKHPFGLAVFENRIYWSDWESLSMESCDKFTGKNQEVLAQGKEIFDIHIYNKALMSPQKHACQHHNCSHICLLSSNSSYKCACPENMEFINNSQTCKQSKIFNFILGFDKHIIIAPQQNFGRHQNSSTYLTTTKFNIMEYNSLTGEVFTANTLDGRIMIHDVDKRKTRVLVEGDILSVKSLAFDYLANNIYWADDLKSTIEVFSLNNKKRTIVSHFPDSKKPLTLALFPARGVIFVVLSSNGGCVIKKMSMEGGEDDEILVEEKLYNKGRVFLAVDEKNERLYWSNSENFFIKSMDFNGRNQKYFTKTRRSTTSLAIINDEIYWTSTGSIKLEWQSLDSNIYKQITIQQPPEIKIMPSLVSVVAGTPLKVTNHSCFIGNGNCSDICVATGLSTRTCLCETGCFLRIDGESICVSQEKCDFKCVTSGECLEKDHRCNGKIECLDMSDEKNCTTTNKGPNFGRSVSPNELQTPKSEATEDRDNKSWWWIFITMPIIVAVILGVYYFKCRKRKVDDFMLNEILKNSDE